MLFLGNTAGNSIILEIAAIVTNVLNWKSFINKTETYSNKKKIIIIKLYENGVWDSNGIENKFYVNFTLNILKKFVFNRCIIEFKGKISKKKKKMFKTEIKTFFVWFWFLTPSYPFSFGR